MRAKDNTNKQIGKVTQVNAIVSYSEEDNAYKNPRKIYELKIRRLKRG